MSIAVIIIGFSILAVTRWSDDLVNRTLLGHAESSAITWRSKLLNSVPEFDRLFNIDAVTGIQTGLIQATMAGSNIFRFETFDPDGTLTFLSDQALFETEEADHFNPSAAAVAQSGELTVAVEDGREAPDRPNHYVEAYMPVPQSNGQVLGVIEVYVDVSGLAEALRCKFNALSFALIAATAAIHLIPTLLLIRRNAQLRERDQAMINLSRQDPLTGLLNRRAFNDACNEIFGTRLRTRTTVGIIFIDLDRFKEVNDTYGHDIGDQILKHVAGIMQKGAQADEVLARLGGDEFVILLPNLAQDNFVRLAQSLLDEAAAGTFRMPNAEIPVHLSIGMHPSPPGETERRAFHCADLALYQAKANGRVQVAAYSAEVELRDLRRRSIAKDLPTALESSRFFLEFQPIFDKSRVIIGFEALLRLKSLDGELISPAEFIPIAAEAGHIDEIGR